MAIEVPEESTWSQKHLVEIAYAFMELGCVDENFFDFIGNALLSRSDINLDARGLGNLAALFSRCEVSCSPQILKLICDKYCSIEQQGTINIQSVVDISSAMYTAQRLQVLSPGILNFVVNVAIEKAHESRSAEDVRDILLNLSRVDLPPDMNGKLLIAYSLYTKEAFQDFAPQDQSEICALYKRSEIIVQELDHNSNSMSSEQREFLRYVTKLEFSVEETTGRDIPPGNSLLERNNNNDNNQINANDTTKNNHQNKVQEQQQDFLSSLKVVELKELCKKHKLKVSGNKAVLIERLRAREP